MITSTRYYIDYGSLADDRYQYFRTLKSLKLGIMKAIDRCISFEIYWEGSVKFSNGYSSKVFFEFAGYDHEKDTVYKYKLRDNIYYKRLHRLERKVWKTLKTYNVKPKKCCIGESYES